MADLPSHPGAGASQVPEAPPDAQPPPGRRLRMTLLAVIVIALAAAMIVLHVTGVVGAGTNG